MGRQHWWPAGSPFEVVVGAYLTQNTAWTNVERVMANLREAGLLSVPGIRDTPLDELERLVRPAGYFRQKAARLKRFVAHLDANYGGSLEQMFTRPTEALRDELLGLPGIGPETADSILLYAANREVFVVDTYTRRIFERHELAAPSAPYEEIRLGVQSAVTEADLPAKPRGRPRPLPPPAAAQPDVRREGRPLPHAPSAASAMQRSELSQRYNEFHALLVQTAKHYCVKGKPKCEHCPLRAMLEGKIIPPA
jgi:endonuclease-3 related protein